MNDIPEDHPIWRIWADGKKPREALAEEGDRDAINGLLVAFRYQWHRNETHPLKDRRMVGEEEIVLPKTLYRFFDRCAERILAGEEPNVVFGWKSGKGQPGRPRLTADEERQRYALAYQVRRRLPPEPKRADIKRAVGEVERETGEAWSTIQEAYARYFTRPYKREKTR